VIEERTLLKEEGKNFFEYEKVRSRRSKKKERIKRGNSKSKPEKRKRRRKGGRRKVVEKGPTLEKKRRITPLRERGVKSSKGWRRRAAFVLQKKEMETTSTALFHAKEKKPLKGEGTENSCMREPNFEFEKKRIFIGKVLPKKKSQAIEE